MPISSDGFDKAKGSLKDSSKRKILKFLQKHRDEAFSQREIAKKLYGNPELPVTDSIRMLGALTFLEAKKQITSEEILEKGEFVKYYKAV